MWASSNRSGSLVGYRGTRCTTVRHRAPRRVNRLLARHGEGRKHFTPAPSNTGPSAAAPTPNQGSQRRSTYHESPRHHGDEGSVLVDRRRNGDELQHRSYDLPHPNLGRGPPLWWWLRLSRCYRLGLLHRDLPSRPLVRSADRTHRRRAGETIKLSLEYQALTVRAVGSRCRRRHTACHAVNPILFANLRVPGRHGARVTSVPSFPGSVGAHAISLLRCMRHDAS